MPAASTADPAAAIESGSWSQTRLHVVTGKGGTGKSTVAAALALALAHGGQRVLLVEVEERQGLAALFEEPALSYQERHLASAPEGGEVFGLAVDPKAALLEYLELFYRLGRAGGLLQKIGAIDFATTIAPGVRDVLLTGKVYEAVRRRTRGQHSYHAVVLDAPPTGRIHRFLNVNSDVAGLAKVGPIRSQADSIMTLLRSPQTSIHLVTLLEELPSQETIEGVAGLRAAALPVGAIIANQVRAPALSQRRLAQAARGTLDSDEVRAGLLAAGLPAGPDIAAGLLRVAAEHAAHMSVQRQERKRLGHLGQPMLQLPALERVDPGDLYGLADVLRAQGLP